MHRQVLYVHCMVEAAGVGKSRGLCGTVVYHGYREYNYRKPSGLSLTIINPRARMRSERLLQLVGQSVGLWFCPHVFSRTVATVDTKRGYVGMCNGRSAQQRSGAASSKNNMFTAGA